MGLPLLTFFVTRWIHPLHNSFLHVGVFPHMFSELSGAGSRRQLLGTLGCLNGIAMEPLGTSWQHGSFKRNDTADTVRHYFELYDFQIANSRKSPAWSP